jgi:transcriptional regulator with XRE-family HTH domain
MKVIIFEYFGKCKLLALQVKFDILNLTGIKSRVRRLDHEFHPSAFDPTKIAEMVGRHVQFIRRKHKVKQDVLADSLGISRTTASNIECGKQRISIDQLYFAAAVIGVAVADLLPPLEVVQPVTLVRTPTDDPLSPTAMGNLINVIQELALSRNPKRSQQKAGRKPLSRKA